MFNAGIDIPRDRDIDEETVFTDSFTHRRKIDDVFFKEQRVFRRCAGKNHVGCITDDVEPQVNIYPVFS